MQTGPLGPSARPLLALFVQPGLSARHLFVREEPSRPFVQLRLERLEPSQPFARLLGLGGLSQTGVLLGTCERGPSSFEQLFGTRLSCLGLFRLSERIITLSLGGFN